MMTTLWVFGLLAYDGWARDISDETLEYVSSLPKVPDFIVELWSQSYEKD